MATETSSIDDMLAGNGNAMAKEPPDYHSEETSEENNLSQESYDSQDSYEDGADESEKSPSESKDLDDYGNDKPEARTYTEDEVNERINKAVRERLARMERNGQQQAATPNNVPQGFEYNSDSEANWQQQLESFVEQTVSRMSSKQAEKHQAHRERQAQEDFEQKFHNNMSRFSDFKDVVGVQPITDSMTLSLRAMNDPAAFIYAASKRNPQELERISKIGDPYSQMVEMGKLEERMRKSSPGTTAPKPLGKTKEDSVTNFTSNKKEVSIEDMIARSEAKKIARIKQVRGR